MTAIVVSTGSRGPIVKRVQAGLAAASFPPGLMDGDFGPRTREAVERFQEKSGMPGTGEIDGETWIRLLGEEPPPIAERCLQLTSGFEGHGYSLACGNHDGAGVTWGIIGFTLAHGSIERIFAAVRQRDPGVVERAFGPLTPAILEVFASSRQEQIAWADSVSTGTQKTGLSRPWRDAFARFGEEPEAQAEQRRLAYDGYFLPAVQTACQFDLVSPLGIALCFDIHVQNGGVGTAARNRIRSLGEGQPGLDERARRIIVAESVAGAASDQWRDDVRARKLAIAAGAGLVHQRLYVLRNWGFGEAETGSADRRTMVAALLAA